MDGLSELSSAFLACGLAFCFGYSANQGGTCLVLAADELHRRRRPRMLVAFLAASCSAGLVAVPLVWSATIGAGLAASIGFSAPLVLGAAAFGIGALVNDTCILGSLARLGDGEIRLAAVPVGLATGLVLVDGMMIERRASWPSILATPSVVGATSLALFLVALILALAFISKMEATRPKRTWRLGTSMLLLGASGGALYAIAPAWHFVSLLQRNLPNAMPVAGLAVLAMVCSIAGAFTASLRQGKLRLGRPSVIEVLRSFFGGTLMGTGVALIPGGNDGLLVAAIPALSPGGAAAYVLMTLTIVLGLVVRGWFGSWLTDGKF